MNHNFFLNEFFIESPRTDSIFWLCDPGGELCSYSTNEAQGVDRRCAVVHNNGRKAISFVPIDKNMLFRRANGDFESLCDGMLYSKDTRELSFVELKEYHGGGYASEAKKQLVSTLRLFLKSHNYQDYKNRRAFACNPVRPCFASSYREQISEFWKEFHFRFLPQAVIVFK